MKSSFCEYCFEVAEVDDDGLCPECANSAESGFLSEVSEDEAVNGMELEDEVPACGEFLDEDEEDVLPVDEYFKRHSYDN